MDAQKKLFMWKHQQIMFTDNPSVQLVNFMTWEGLMWKKCSLHWNMFLSQSINGMIKLFRSLCWLFTNQLQVSDKSKEILKVARQKRKQDAVTTKQSKFTLSWKELPWKGLSKKLFLLNKTDREQWSLLNKKDLFIVRQSM